jgi:hypothetical protein
MDLGKKLDNGEFVTLAELTPPKGTGVFEWGPEDTRRRIADPRRLTGVNLSSALCSGLS